MKNKNVSITDIWLLFLAFLVCMPVILVVFGSLKSNIELTESLAPVLKDVDQPIFWSIFPLYPTLKHYISLLFKTPQFFVLFGNSVKIVGSILLGQVVVGTPAAWAFARFQFPCRKLLFTLYVILMLMPFQVMMLPDYLVFQKLGLLNHQAAVILPAVFSTFSVFIMYRGFRMIPVSILEAAKVDGASDFAIFIRIGLPLGSAGILSALVLSFLDNWNMIEQPLTFLKEQSLWPLSLYLSEIDASRAGMAFATSVIALIPAVFVFLLGQDYLEQGITATGVKE